MRRPTVKGCECQPVRVLCGILLAAALAGCQVLPGAGPNMNDAAGQSTSAMPYDVVNLDAVTVAAYRPDRSDSAPAPAPTLKRGQATLASGDTVRVKIYGKYEGGPYPTLRDGGAGFGARRIDETGNVKVPYAGNVRVAGLTIPEAEMHILTQLPDKTQEPQVVVELAEDRSHTIMISGEIKSPGRLSTLDGVNTVVEAIDRAGGPVTGTQSTSHLEVVVRRSGSLLLRTQLPKLLNGNDIRIEPGDEIVLRPNARTFSAFGAVMKAGNVDIARPDLSLLEALGAVGGLMDDRANKTGVYVFRLGDPDDPTSRSKIFRLDLMQPVSMFVAQQFNVRDRDVIYVTNAPLYEYDKALTAFYRTVSVYGVLKD